ncbi:endo-beta-N-acetylglucosaminidase [Luteolibacter luteus]|uniref:Fibronectin type-III domain-containing protein n=1 Tax=Luteolibacter luteus TaxID=2728835 RepID=A0A858RJZ2_9BACT|nr:hypothetical protein [Luteolibacter luteus]QJE96891.1 hypothetical protein HHL09_14220 [Luteolibacter luteus]
MPQSNRWHPNEILTWSPATDPNAPYNRGTVPLASRFTAPTAAENAALNALWNVNPHARPGEARVQAVTTFNTIPAGAPNGWRTTRLYAPSIWQYTDNMVFWGSSDRDNRVIMCPTAHMIDAAHRNGVRIYGKIFYGWNGSPDNASLQRVRDLLQKSGSTFPVADKLVEAAKYFGFDGWFINQENYQTNGTDAQNMRDFMVYFRTRAAAQGAPHLRITWYDAMAENGSRSFQNALTDQNDGYLKSGAVVTNTGTTLAAHEMFLNFWWYYNSSNLSNSRTLAQSRGINPYDLYAGIWTENYRTLGKTPDPNSQGNLDITWPYLFPEGQPHHTSVALFGAETPYVKSSSPETMVVQDQLYWSGPNSDPSSTTPVAGSPTPNWYGMAHYIPANSPLTTLPFVTNFNVGQGNFYKINGSTVMTGPWTNLGVQDVLPTWRWLVTSAGAKSITPSLDFAESYYGGSSLKVSGSLAANVPQEVKLYQARLPIAADTSLKMVYKPGAVNNARVQVGYAFEDSPGVMNYTTAATAASTNWSTLNVSLGAHAGKKIALITLRFSSTSAIDTYAANIGRLQVSNGSVVAPAAPAGLTLEGKSRNPDEALSTMLKLKWTASASPVLYYNVYHRKNLTASSPRVWLGATPNNYYFAQDVRRFGSETNGYIEIEAVGPDHGVSPVATTSQPTFAFESFPNLHRPFIASYPVASPLTVIGSGDLTSAARAFDNNVSTFAEPGGASGAWVGLDLGAGNAKQVVAIQFVPRTNQSGRMTNGVFQGSNTADFSSGVVELAKVNWVPPQGVTTTLMVNNATAFRYLRYLSPNDGYANVAEIRFFGPGNPLPPEKSMALQATNAGTTATLTWQPALGGVTHAYDVKRGSVNGGSYTVVAADIAATSFLDSGLTTGATYYYVVVARNDAGQSGDSDRLILNPTAGSRLNGSVIGTDGSWNNQGDTKARVFDGSLTTFFDAPNADGAWAGMDLGTPRKITAIRYSPRNGATNWPERMVGGIFQAADNLAFNNPVTLFTVPVTPTYNVFTTVAVANQGLYRYVRYLSPNGGHCNVSEIQFHGVTLPAAPSGLAVNSPGATATITWNALSTAQRYRLKRSTTSGSGYQVVGDNLATTSFQDGGLDPQQSYYYVVSAVNEAGEGVNSAEVARHDAFGSWIVSSGGNPGSPEAGFGADLDGDGIPNGVEYMLPAGARVQGGAVLPGIVAVIRDDATVTVKLWFSMDLTAWSELPFTDAADQGGVPGGFRRVERLAAPAAGETAGYYRFEFSK